MVLFWIVILLFIAYSILIFFYLQGWNSVPVFISAEQPVKTKISVIIPARNEERNIGSLLHALQRQTYPADQFEVIVIDDHSEDNTAEIVKTFGQINLLSLGNNVVNSYKKKAIETGIAAASGDLIVSTDADCVPPPDWLRTIAEFQVRNQSAFIAAPVVIDCSSSLVQIFQAMDFMVLQGITGAVTYKNQLSMCNGANLAYEKKVFKEVGGFEAIDQIASGDDMLLMYKIEKSKPGKVHYLKSQQAIVATQPVNTWKDFFQQRIRWASKARQYDDKRILPVLLLVYIFNFSFFILLVAGIWKHDYWLIAIGFLIVKTLVELPFYASVAGFFDKRWSIKWFFFFQPLHITYTVIAGLFGQWGSYSWKGRRVR